MPTTPQAQALSQHSLATFERVVGGTPGFRLRAGQHAMAQCIAQTLATADLGEHSAPAKGIAVVQAGTGLGLHVAHTIARNHGGTLAVTNLAKGCAFTLKIPYEFSAQRA